jgi:hypothetical protein
VVVVCGELGRGGGGACTASLCTGLLWEPADMCPQAPACTLLEGVRMCGVWATE